jgi:hypothetical protein
MSSINEPTRNLSYYLWLGVTVQAIATHIGSRHTLSQYVR